MNDPARPRSGQRIWAAVPFRGPVGSKRRLAGLLDASERERLSLEMLHDVLGVLLASNRVERVLLLTLASDAVEIPGNERLIVVEEPRGDGDVAAEARLNAALTHAQRVADAADADSLLIVPADLPVFAESDLDALLDLGDSRQCAVAADRAGLGTNALLLSPPSILSPGFGEDSFVRHRRQAEAAGVTLSVLARPGLALDLDTPADVAVLLARGHACRAATLLRELRVEGRLEQLETAQARSTTI